ncbi:hypothetical protein AB0A74_01160 [Saccharothrix sp. NPDC042600]|uniref:beta strand repeat-containing protein n=1 Tax=Saccharothrix TaxID=2071 RepID=UPI0033F6D4DD|nr:DUF11 domain-containing protein [Saccharothrix mutabilis subsp. capreolus]
MGLRSHPASAESWVAHDRPRARRSRPAAVLLAIVAALAALLSPVDRGQAAPGTPGTPQPGTTPFLENFENSAVTIPTLVTGYTGSTGSSGATYTADPGWLRDCNGWVMDGASAFPAAAGTAGCAVSNWSNARSLAEAIGRFQGVASPARNRVLSAFTGNCADTASPQFNSGQVCGGANQVQLRTQSTFTTVANHFYTVAVTTAYMNCGSPHPQYSFSLVAGTSTFPTTSTPIDGCDHSNTVVVNGQTIQVGRSLGDTAVMPPAGPKTLRLVNGQGSAVGNDGALDDLAIVDVTPQLDKEFSPTAVPTGGVTTLTFTLTNTDDLLAKPGTSWTDTLPAGLVVASPANATTTCANGSVTATAGGTTAAYRADLLAGQASCTLSVDVTSAAAGTYTNSAANVGSPVGVLLPGSASVQFIDPSLVLTKRVSQSSARPGDVLTFTVTARNASRVDFLPTLLANLSDDLSAALDDATYNNDAVVTVNAGPAGTVSYAEPVLSWEGLLQAGATATITYTMTVDSPLTGDLLLDNTVTSTVPGTAPAGTSTPLARMSLSKTADTGVATAGSTVTYTLTVQNTGQAPLTNAQLSDDLTGVLDDAALTTTSAGVGVVSVSGATLSWSGSLDPGETAVITYTVTVRNPVSGDGRLRNSATTTTPGGPTTPVTTDTPISAIALTKNADRAVAAAGSPVTYTVTIRNSGQVPITAATFTDDLAGVLDDAALGAVNATTGTVSTTGSSLTWTGDLAPGESATITYSVTVNNPVTGDGRLRNSARSTTPGAPPSPVVTTTPITAVTLTKTVDQASVAAGGTVTYTVSVTNTGATPLNPARFTDDLSGVLDDASVLSLTSSVGSAAVSATTLTWSGNLATGATATVRYTVTVRNPVSGDGVLRNSVTSTTAGAPGTPIALDTPITAMTVTKSVSQPAAAAGDTVTYTVTVRNTGTTPVPGATFTDDLSGVLDDAVFGTVTATTGSTSLSPPTLTWTGDLAVGATETVTYTVVVDNPVTGDSRLRNSVTTTTPGASVPASATDTPVTSFTLEKSVSTAVAAAGDTVTYTVVMTNTGSTTITDATFTDDLSGVLDDGTLGIITATTGSTAVEPTTLTWTGTLSPGLSVTVRYAVRVHNPVTGDGHLRNSAASDIPGGPAAPVATDTVISALTVDKTVDRATTAAGDTVTYRLTVTNTGAAAISGAGVADDLIGVLDDATFGSVTANTGTASFTSPTLTWTGDLAPGQSATITYTVTVNNPVSGDRRLVNSATTSTPGGPTTPSTTITPVTAMTVSKTVDRTTAVAGGTVTYTVTVRNTGVLDIPDATFTDDLAMVLDDAVVGTPTASLGSASVTGPTLVWTGALPAGETATITYPVVLNDPVTGDAVLRNTVTTTTPGASVLSPTATTRVTAMTVSKTVDRTTAVAGGTVTYTVTVGNPGATTISNATFTDDLSGVLDDAVIDSLTASAGTPRSVGNSVRWNGTLAPGAVATITYTIIVRNPVTGDGNLHNSVTSTSPGATVAPAVTDTPITAMTLTKTADRTTVAAGGTVTYTVVVTNTGRVPISGAEFTDDLSGVLDDATPGPVTATSGTAALGSSALTWTGDLAPGGSATVTYTATVANPVVGDGRLRNSVTTTTPGGPTAPATTDTRVTALTLAKTVDRGTAAAGDTVTYTVTLHNTGTARITGAEFTDDLSGALDDAVWGTVVASTGTATFASPVLTWTGDLVAGGSAVVRYTVTVDNPVTGDGHLRNSASTTTPGGPATASTTDTPVTSVALTKSVDKATAAAGDTVTYTVTITNTGTTAIPGAQFTDSLNGVLDDASFGSASATTGTVTATLPRLTWTGDLPVGGSATATYSVVVANPLRGDGNLHNSVTTATAGGPGSPVTTDTALRGLTFGKSVDRATVVAGDTVTYTLTATNAGRVPITGAVLTDDLSGVLDDAEFVDAAADSGSASSSGSTLTWTGDLAVGQTATTTYRVRVRNPVTGDLRLANSVSSPTPGAPTSPVTTATDVRSFTVDKSVGTAAALAGGAVTYTVTITNTGATAITGAEFTDDLSGVLDDATFGDVDADLGRVAFTSPILTWRGSLPRGGTATVTYTVHVNNPVTGDRRMHNVVTDVSAGGSLLTSTTETPVVSLVVTLEPDRSATEEGGAVTYTVTVTNTGSEPIPDAAFDIDLSGVLDDGQVELLTSSLGTAVLDASVLRWTGSLAPGQSSTTTYRVVVDRPDTGDHNLRNVVSTPTPGGLVEHDVVETPVALPFLQGADLPPGGSATPRPSQPGPVPDDSDDDRGNDRGAPREGEDGRPSFLPVSGTSLGLVLLGGIMALVAGLWAHRRRR